MTRIIVITKCAECPHCDNDWPTACCNALDFMLYGYKETIPSWCPLERAETKGASEDE